MDVQPGEGVDARHGCALDKEVGLERPEVTEVEHRTRGLLEPVGTLAGEDLAAVAERWIASAVSVA